MLMRPRRLRISSTIRSMVEETQVRPSDLMAPMFLLESANAQEPIETMPGIFRQGIEKTLRTVEGLLKNEIKSIALFPVVDEKYKDESASFALKEDNFYHQAIATLKKTFPELMIMTDVAMDPYSTYGHDGVYCPDQKYIKNDETLPILGKMALVQAQAGADIIGPSDMMDGRVLEIRETLEKNNYSDRIIMSYSAKYASCFYGPFRDALGSAPKFGDKKTYQMDPANSKEAIKEMELDYTEGADIFMVKPAGAYLDVIKTLSDACPCPVAAYQVSGEYSLLVHGAQKGLVDLAAARDESLLAIKRAGAKIILTYFAHQF